VLVPVLVNGVLTQLPAIHTQGNFYSYMSEFWFLDQPDNPLTLRFRIGIDDLAPLSPYDREKCQQDAELLGYLPQYCTHPDGGEKAARLVKINYCCGGRVPRRRRGRRRGLAVARELGQRRGIRQQAIGWR
jgi:hypothetical protein